MASLSPSLTRELSDSALFLLKITDLETEKDFQRRGGVSEVITVLVIKSAAIFFCHNVPNMYAVSRTIFI